MADSEEDYYWDRGNEGVNRQEAFSQEWKKAEKEKKMHNLLVIFFINCSSTVACVKYSIVTYIYIYICFYYVGKFCTDITQTNSRAK